MIAIDLSLEVGWGFTIEDITITWLWAFISFAFYVLLRMIDYPKGKTKVFDQYVVAMLNSLLVIVLGWDILIFGDNNSFLDINEDKQVTLCPQTSRLCIVFDLLPYPLRSSRCCL